MSDKLPRMDYRQHRRARRLVHECCNYDEGNCLLLDDGEPCVYTVLPGVDAVFDLAGGGVWMLCVDFHGRFDCRCSRAF